MQERNKMSLEGFAKCVAMDLQAKLGDSYTVKVTDVIKNNGVKLKGLIITAPNQRITPTIYLENFYQQYYNSDETIDDLVAIECAILQFYERESTGNQIDMNFFKQWALVKDRICCKLIGYQSNEVLLKQVPHFHVMDLAVVFYYLFQDERLGDGSILIYNNHLDIWGIDKEELLAVAKVNTPKFFPRTLNSMFSIIEGMMGSELAEDVCTEGLCPMYVVSNSKQHNGAIYMLDTELLKRFAHIHGNCDVWILPSSIHECILVPDSMDMDFEALKTMVHDVNSTQVPTEEILSNSVYKFNYEREQIFIGGMDYE